MKKYALIPLAAALLPFVAFAQSSGGVSQLLRDLAGWIDIATPIVFALAFLAFFWGLLRYIFAKGDPASTESGRNIMIWAVIALFVMVSIFGIIRLLQETFHISGAGVPTLPEVPATGIPTYPI